MPIYKGTVPETYRFLEEIVDSIKLEGEGASAYLDGLRITLHYTTAHEVLIVFDRDAIVHLDVRFIEQIVNFVSCLRLEEPQASQARAFLVVYNLALDTALSLGHGPLLAGMAFDYLVSRVTAVYEVADSCAPEIDFKGNDLKTVAEIAGAFVVAHECNHWLLAHRTDFRENAIERAKNLAITMRDYATSAANREVFGRLADEFVAVKASDPLRGGLEEWICDMTAAEAIAETTRKSQNRATAEATVFATSILLWTLSRLRRLFRNQGETPESIDETFMMERGAVVMSQFLAERHIEKDSLGDDTDIEISHLKRMQSLIDYAISGFLDDKNINRLLALGTVALQFGFTEDDQVRNAIAAAQGWVDIGLNKFFSSQSGGE